MVAEGDGEKITDEDREASGNAIKTGRRREEKGREGKGGEGRRKEEKGGEGIKEKKMYSKYSNTDFHIKK